MNSDLQNRLYQFEVNPPATVWNKILLALEQSTLPEEFPSKLYNYQTTPPPGMWQRISSVLYKNGEIKTAVPFISRIKPYYRYAAAAVLVGVITFLISFLINKQNIANVAVKKTVPPSKQESVPAFKTNDQANIQKPGTGVLSNNLPELYKKKLPAVTFTTHSKSLEHPMRNKMMNPPINYSFPAALETNYSAFNLENDPEYLDDTPRAITYDQSKISRINNYMVLLSPDGNIIRISKKFADMIGCMYTPPSNISTENCHDQINSWRKKMAKSVVTPSQDNFMDILTLIKSLQDN